MKKPVLTPHDKTRILIACVELPVVQGPPMHAVDYMRDLMVTVLDFYMQVDAAEASLSYFRDHVQSQNNIHTHERLCEIVFGFPDDREGDSQASHFFWNNNHWKRARLLRRLLTFLTSIGVSDQASLHAWARQASFERDFQGKVHGLGLAVFQWLIIRCGVETVKPDIWVYRFAQRILGRKISDRVIVALFNELAPLVGTSMSQIDSTIWGYERMGLGIRDVPALRIVFWRQVVKRLEDRIAADKDLAAGHWIITLDAAELLRYDRAGVRMSGKLRLPGELRRTTTRIGLTQAPWQERFELRLTLVRDKPLEESVWAAIRERMEQDGWIINNEGKFESGIGVDVELIMPPDISIETLMTRVEDVVDRTTKIIAIPVSTQVALPDPEPAS